MSRARRAKALLTTFLRFHLARLKRVRRRKRIAKRNLRKGGLSLPNHRLPAPRLPESSSSSTSSGSMDTDSNSPSSSSQSSSSQSSSTSNSRSSSTSDSESDDMSDYFHKAMEDLDSWMNDLETEISMACLNEDLFSSSEDSESNSDTDTSSSSDSDYPTGLSCTPGNSGLPRKQRRRLHRQTQKELSAMYANRYEASRKSKKKPPPQLPFILRETKHTQPVEFRQDIRVSPYTFDRLVQRIENDSIFTSGSDNGQMPVESQLAITLYRFGHYGNAAGLSKVARWAGVGKGTVLLTTKRVMTALLRPDFVEENLRMPTEEEKNKAKDWVEKHSCPEWRNGWCLVDGTLVPLFDRPHWFGESYFDRKSNYSLNFQIVSLPNLRIIDVGYGFTGSTHDASAWEKTRIKQNHTQHIKPGEWIWADSAYPISDWVVAPYKRPERDLPENQIFNNHVSMVRIRSEHAIGFLKGRCQSLKDLRINISDEKSHKFATYWGLACILVHNYAMTCEEEEQRQRGDTTEDPIMDDPFLREGLEGSDGDNDDDFEPAFQSARQRLTAGRQRREGLKDVLFRWTELRRDERRQREFGIDS